MVLSSHRMDDLAALCSEVTILTTGRVVFSGPVGKLAAESGDSRLPAADLRPRGRAAGRDRDARSPPARRPTSDSRQRPRHPRRARTGTRAGRPGRPAGRCRRRGARAGAGRGTARGRLPRADRHRARHSRTRGTSDERQPLALPRTAARRAPLLRLLRLRARQAALPVADPARPRGLLDRPGRLRRRGERAELAAGRHGLRPLDARDRLGRTRWWCWPSRARGRCRC